MKKKLLFSFLTIWFLGTSYTIAHMHGLHLVSFSHEKLDSNIEINEISNDWGMIHVLAEGCGCSEIIADYLIERKSLKDVSESIMLLGETKQYAVKLKEAGFKILSSKDIKGYVEGVPLLIIHNKIGDIMYSGGYANNMVTPITKIQDINLLKQVKNNINPKDYLVMGCAVAMNIKKELDPLGLKY